MPAANCRHTKGINGKFWLIEAAGEAQPVLYRILKKIGGDPVVGSYLTPKTGHYHKMPDKIRYAVNVRRERPVLEAAPGRCFFCAAKCLQMPAKEV